MVVPRGGDQIHDVESDRRVDVHMCRHAKGVEMG